MRTTILTSVAFGWLVLSGTTIEAEPERVGQPTGVEAIATGYVKLVLAMGQHDPDYVDAFYGPAEWKSAAEKEKPLEAIGAEATQLGKALDEISAGIADSKDRLGEPPKPAREPRALPGNDETERLRREYLAKQLSALEARVRTLKGARLKFDEESRALYDAVAPTLPESDFDELLDRISGSFDSIEKKQAQSFAGKSRNGDSVGSDNAARNTSGSLDFARNDKAVPLAQRYEQWRKPFVIPKEKLDAVFQLAIKECRKRTLAHIKLPPNESFTVEYVTDKPWGGYNWYKGNYRSVIQVNTDLPTYIDRAIDLAAHEGYPGHHVYNALLEKNLVRDRGWVEFSVYALFSPQSLIAEGTANFGREVVFTKPERMKFEKEVLFPAAGIDPARAEEYYVVQELVKQLAYARNEAARRLINGEIDANAAATWLEKYALLDPARAKQAVKFSERYRSYVINYNLGEDMVRSYIEKRGGTEDQPEKRWREFEQLLSSPRLPSGLR